MRWLFGSRTSSRKAAGALPSDLQLAGTLDFEAAEGDETLPKFKLVANTGAPMEVDGWPYPVIVDLAGVSFHKSPTPVILHHDRSLRIGHTTEQAVKAGRRGAVTARGVVSSTTQAAREYVDDSRNGFPFEVSLGARTHEVEFVDAGETTKVNGRTHKGPCYVARETVVRELTVDPLGADGKTSAKIAASKKPNHKGTPKMFEEWLEAHGLDLETLGEESRSKLEATYQAEQEKDQKIATLEAGAKKRGAPEPDPDDGDDAQTKLKKQRQVEAAETERVDSIRALFASQRYSDLESVQPDDESDKTIKPATFKAKAIRDGLSPDQVELVLMRASFPGGGNEGPAIHVQQPFEGHLHAEALSCALARSLGMPASIEARGKKFGYEHQFSKQALEASDDRRIRNPSLHLVMDRTIQAASGLPFTGNRKSRDFVESYVEAALKVQGGPRVPTDLQSAGPTSTLTVAYVLENVANKMADQRFAMIKVAYPEIAKIKPLNDFRPHTIYRLDENLGYLQVGADGQLKSGQLTDTKKTVQAASWGRLIALTYQDARNDDLSVFDQIVTGLVEGAAWAKEAEMAALLLGNAGSFFSAGNGNLIDNDLGIAGLTAAETAYANQTSTSGKPIMVGADRVLVGTQDKVLADQLFGSANLLDSTANATQTFVENPHRSKYRVIEWPYLNNTSIKKPNGSAISANQSSDVWFLLGNPAVAGALILGAVDGKLTPTIESAETSFDTLGMQWRGHDHWGVAQGDTQGAVMSSGDGESA